MGSAILILIGVNIGMVLEAEPIRPKLEQASNELTEKVWEKINTGLYETFVDIFLDAIILYCVIKRDRIAVLIFAWVCVAQLILPCITSVFGIITVDRLMPTLQSNYDSDQSTTINNWNIAMIIVGLIILVLEVVKIVFMFKLSKSLKRQNHHDTCEKPAIV
ncbi:unnamed protein product [Rotaria magnacalcarata]|uniref:Uncharacterized protein n=1 Tax=Rotaria magnacalcarata TaxID=392030 RepID=A0A817A000_9BILA|nr:unnamed protein product [Rotaria magnacalcarata]CAF1679042.1 unnamed protein product [Rotaria magnacalcarata]CAF2063882.1 unnamed protein product [Rotaria magnacalcarata]CAF2219629.1 unnamed protein product [Rotaria magnacalcarata]CAF2242713.1 unnamed protein product [Rotaria magnacalcarata]